MGRQVLSDEAGPVGTNLYIQKVSGSLWRTMFGCFNMSPPLGCDDV